MQSYEECDYIVDPRNFPSRAAKAVARRMPQFQARLKKARSVSEDWQMEEEDDTEEQMVEQVTHALGGKLHATVPTQTKSLKVPMELKLLSSLYCLVSPFTIVGRSVVLYIHPQFQLPLIQQLLPHWFNPIAAWSRAQCHHHSFTCTQCCC